MEALDTINLFDLPKNKSADPPNTSSYNNNNSLVVSDKDFEDDRAFVKRTRSRTRMLFAMSSLNLDKFKPPELIRLLKQVLYSILFFLYNSVATADSYRLVGDITGLGQVKDWSYESTIVSHTAKMMDKLHYIFAFGSAGRQRAWHYRLPRICCLSMICQASHCTLLKAQRRSELCWVQGQGQAQ